MGKRKASRKGDYEWVDGEWVWKENAKPDRPPKPEGPPAGLDWVWDDDEKDWVWGDDAGDGGDGDGDDGDGGKPPKPDDEKPPAPKGDGDGGRPPKPDKPPKRKAGWSD